MRVHFLHPSLVEYTFKFHSKAGCPENQHLQRQEGHVTGLLSWSPWELPCDSPCPDEGKAVVTVTLELATRGQLPYVINMYSGDGVRITAMRFRRYFSFQ